MDTKTISSSCHLYEGPEWIPEEGSPAFDRGTPAYSFEKCERIAHQVLGVLNDELGIRVDMSDVRGPAKHREIAYARQAIWLILRDHYAMTFDRLGQVTNRNHSTVINGVQALRGRASVPGIDARAMRSVYLRLGIQPKFSLHGWKIAA